MEEAVFSKEKLEVEGEEVERIGVEKAVVQKFGEVSRERTRTIAPIHLRRSTQGPNRKIARMWFK